jgi:hypothetical protein
VGEMVWFIYWLMVLGCNVMGSGIDCRRVWKCSAFVLLVPSGIS